MEFIESLHQGATSVVKWAGQISEILNVNQGVRQGGLLNAFLHKLYINPLLVQLEETNLGSRIGKVLCNATACADDLALMASSDEEMQVLINIDSRFANMEGYKLQTKKSVLLE